MNCNFLWALLLMVLGAACENVEDGYRINYSESSAEFNVTLATPDRGAIGDTVSYEITISAVGAVKSLFVETDVSGASGSSFTTLSDESDPFIDHDYGTIQPKIYDIDLTYNYIVGQDTVDAELNFTLVDETGKKTIKHTVLTVSSIVNYSSVELYTKSSTKADGFSTFDGVVYADLSQYQELSTVNNAVQESLDMVFLVKDGSAIIAAPYNGSFSSEMGVKNKTLFKKLETITSNDFAVLTNASLSQFVEDQEVKKGSTSVFDIKVGDIIGFRTDFASSNAYKYGILRVKALHPTGVAHYEGISYVMEFDLFVQKD